MWPIPPYAFEISPWSDDAPLYTLKMLLRSSHTPNVSTIPKVASAVNIPSHAQSSHSGEGNAWASLDENDTLEDDFQTPHTLVHHVMRWEDDSRRCPAEGRPESSRGSPGQPTEYQVDIGEEGDTLEMVDPTWRTTCRLQLAVQGISDDEVPLYKLIHPLTAGTEGAALSLAKHLLTVWRWSIKVQGWDVCPPTPTALNIGQFMTQEEAWGNVDNSLWFAAYSCALQRVGEVVRGWQWQWPRGKVPEAGVSPLIGAFWEETGIELATSCTTLLGTSSKGCIQKEGKGRNFPCDHLSGWHSHAYSHSRCLG